MHAIRLMRQLYVSSKALEMETVDELRVSFDGHADFLHDESRNAAYRRAIDIAAKGSK